MKKNRHMKQENPVAINWRNWFLLFVLINALGSNAFALERIRLDFDWRFFRGDIPIEHLARLSGTGIIGDWKKARTYNVGVSGIDYDDSGWRLLDLPHDFRMEGAYTPDASHWNGSLAGEIGWYRKTFEIPEEDKGQRFYLEFEGMFRNSRVYVNGFYVDRHLSGYAPLCVDVTEMLQYGEKNIVAVRVDATNDEGWFYEGGGIYRHVWLIKAPPVHAAPYGIFVNPTFADRNKFDLSMVELTTEVSNRGTKGANCQVEWRILDPQGNQVATELVSVEVESWGQTTAVGTLIVKKPQLWSLETPQLYRLITTVSCDGHEDITETIFGIRQFYFDDQNRFVLNGQPVFLQGVNCHQDHAGVGAAVPDRLQAWRIETLKAMGCNAYRAAHNPPTPALLDACDRLGMIVLSENRIVSTSPEVLRQLESLIRRDRNHPSVCVWVLGNEDMAIQGTDMGQSIAQTMMSVVRRLDPSRPMTIAMNGKWGQGFSHVVDIQGCNYLKNGDINAFHEKFPNKPILFTECAGAACTRGVYEEDSLRGHQTAYDITVPPWSTPVVPMWQQIMARPFIAGAFPWTGFDYRGETWPQEWPNVTSQFGFMDVCGFPKDNYYYFKAWWQDEDVLHVFPHWNWPDKHGQAIDVRVFSNLEAVELLLNDNSLGRKSMKPYGDLRWEVPYQPGTLLARGFRDGKIVLEKRLETTGAAHTIRLRPDRSQLLADRSDLAVVEVAVLDQAGRVVPQADNDIRFSVEGPARILGVGNGNPSSHEPDKAENRRVFNGYAQVLVQTTESPGSIILRADSPGLLSTEVTLKVVWK